MENDEIMVEELKLVQNVINRMSSNSFHIKGWAITLIVGILILKSDTYSILIAFIPLLIFWYLDGYFLHKEKKFRKLYEWIVSNRLKSDEHMFDLDTSRCPVPSKFKIMFSQTLGLLYGSIGILIFLYMIVSLITS